MGLKKISVKKFLLQDSVIKLTENIQTRQKENYKIGLKEKKQICQVNIVLSLIAVTLLMMATALVQGANKKMDPLLQKFTFF